MATARDAQAGWNIYRSSGYSFTLDEINEKLAASGFNAVAPRTYSHYRKLYRYGYQRYVPINQLDVETLRDPVWGGALQSRFRFRPTKQKIQLLVSLEDDVIGLRGDLVQLSDVQGSAVVDVRNSPLEPDPRAIEGSHTLVILGDSTKAAVVEIVQPTAEDPSIVAILFLFFGFVPTVELAPLSGLPVAQAVFRVTTQEQGSPVVVLRSLYSLFEAIDSARLVCDQVLDTLEIVDKFAFPPTRIDRLSFGSPLVADVSLGEPLLVIIAGLLGSLEYLRRKHFEANIARGQAKILDAKADVFKEHARKLRIDNDRREIAAFLDVKALVSYIVDAVAAKLPPEQRQRAEELTPDSLDRVAELAEKQLLPDTESLFEAPTESIEVETTETIPPLLDEEAADQEDGE